MPQNNLQEIIGRTAVENGFSGAVAAACNGQVYLKDAFGYANRADKLPNTPETLFGIASGCKIFTAVAICQLAEQGRLVLESKLAEHLELSLFPLFDRKITIHHLLTHSSGIPDYFDEEIMDDFEELWKERPMYGIRRLEDFLPLFREREMKFSPGERFHYNNAGYIVLGLIIEKISGMEFTEYVEQHIFRPCGMQRSGYFAMDRLPSGTAQGYIEEEGGMWRSNIYSLPVKGGSDGGAFVTAPEMLRFWDELLAHRLLGPQAAALLLTPHIQEENDEYYGYGVWISKRDGNIVKYHLMGSDPGVSFRSAFYPGQGAAIAVTCNASRGAYKIMKAMEEQLL